MAEKALHQTIPQFMHLFQLHFFFHTFHHQAKLQRFGELPDQLIDINEDGMPLPGRPAQNEILSEDPQKRLPVGQEGQGV